MTINCFLREIKRVTFKRNGTGLVIVVIVALFLSGGRSLATPTDSGDVALWFLGEPQDIAHTSVAPECVFSALRFLYQSDIQIV